MVRTLYQGRQAKASGNQHCAQQGSQGTELADMEVAKGGTALTGYVFSRTLTERKGSRL